MMTTSKLLSLGFLFIGVFILIQVISPLFLFKLWEVGQNLSSTILISPKSPDNKILGVSILSQDNFPSFVSVLKRPTTASYSQFSLSVPTLKIDTSPVDVDSNDLSKRLAHLPGSALPGEKGNVFISGHSAISWIFSGFQKAIFAKLMDLKKGDQILVSADGTNFTYQVVETRVVDPTDLSVVNPPDNLGRYITLMTCVPPGLNTKRLVVLGKMI